jgi:phosphocarrier protein
MDEELVEDLLVVNQLGIHARPAAALVQTVLQFQSDVHLQVNNHRVNAKSIMGVLTLAAAQGTRVRATCRGADAKNAMDALQRLFESGFGEE